MYTQHYNLDLPTNTLISFDCTSSTRFNLEFFNAGTNPLTSVEIDAVFTPGGVLQPWLTILSHFDPAGPAQPMIKGIHGFNVYNLAPGDAGIISFNCEYIYSLRVAVDAVSGKIDIKGYGE
jgi:hypothetical protein